MRSEGNDGRCRMQEKQWSRNGADECRWRADMLDMAGNLLSSQQVSRNDAAERSVERRHRGQIRRKTVRLFRSGPRAYMGLLPHFPGVPPDRKSTRLNSSH